MTEKEMIAKIKELKKMKRAAILAHNYQTGLVQDIADHVGDSFALSRIATELEEEVVVMCGVRFMAETVKILSPEKRVLLPVLEAGCPMAGMITVDQLRAFRNEHPGSPVVCYVNTSAAIKAESDICCTSSNAVQVISSLPEDKVLFVPDHNLGSYADRMIPEKQVISWSGHCYVHQQIQKEEIMMMRRRHPDAEVLVHPECNLEVTAMGDFVGSTAQIIDYVRRSPARSFIVVTEVGILHQLHKENPGKVFYPVFREMSCYDMKKTGIGHVMEALQHLKHEIQVEKGVLERAHRALERMLRVH
jgi:quinolinate synthase